MCVVTFSDSNAKESKNRIILPGHYKTFKLRPEMAKAALRYGQ